MSELRILHFPQTDITKGDLVLEITGNGGYLGRLYLSKGSLDFLAKDKQHNTISLSWDKFARVMEKIEKKRRRKLKKRRKK